MNNSITYMMDTSSSLMNLSTCTLMMITYGVMTYFIGFGLSKLALNMCRSDYIGRELCRRLKPACFPPKMLILLMSQKTVMEITKIPLGMYWFKKHFLFILVTNEVLTMSQA
jgi:hypothetical protein